jgi:hypothetical protein
MKGQSNMLHKHINMRSDNRICIAGRGKTRMGISRRHGLLQVLFAVMVFIHISASSAICGVKTKLDEERWFELGMRLQGWYQSFGEAGSPHINDFMLRRAYVYAEGQVYPKVTFYAHIAGDRLGQDGVDTPGSGLGTGFSLRDGWIAYAPFNELKIQAGRMYIPLTRAFGTESTFTLLTLDVPIAQGGVRGKGFFPSNVGRDDGLVVWGNLSKGLVQYRVGVFDGQQGSLNAQKHPRTAARISINPLDAEEKWFNKGNYLGTKKILSLGAGFDMQKDLKWAANRPTSTYSAWTTDLFFDHPIGSSAVNFEWAYTGIKNSQDYGDAKTWYAQGGVLVPPVVKAFRLQPFMRYEAVYRRDTADTQYAGAGMNLLFKQHDLKLTLEFDKYMPESGSAEKSKAIFTVQIQVGI